MQAYQEKHCGKRLTLAMAGPQYLESAKSLIVSASSPKGHCFAQVYCIRTHGTPTYSTLHVVKAKDCIQVFIHRLSDYSLLTRLLDLVNVVRHQTDK